MDPFPTLQNTSIYHSVLAEFHLHAVYKTLHVDANLTQAFNR